MCLQVAVGWSQVPKWPPLGELTIMSLPWGVHYHCPCPYSEPQLTPASPGPPLKTQRQVQPILLWSHCFALGPSAYENLCGLSQSRVCISSSPAETLHSSPAGLQRQMLWGLPLSMPEPQSLMWDSKLSLLLENFCNVFIFQFVRSPPSQYGV